MADFLYLEPVGGIAGDMFLAAALDLGVSREALERALSTLGVSGFRLAVTRAEAGGLEGTHVDVLVDPQPEHHGHGRALSEIVALVEASGLPARARTAAVEVFRRIGEAEAKVHRVPVEAVHFHEVGAVDSIVDICGAAVVLDLLGWPRVFSAPPELGQGFVTAAHGRLPVPSPAVLEILRGVPIRPGGPLGEAVTPTGAALLAVLAEVAEPGEAPTFAPRAIGVGVGTARWTDRPNVLRMTLGSLTQRPEALYLLEANLDDCSGQLVARAIEVALEQGAVDAWATPCTMKKGRPGIVLAALAPAARRDAVARAFAAETTTLGVRHRPVERLELDREHVAVETRYGEVRVKVGRLGGETLGAYPEHDDCLSRAREHGVPLKEVLVAAVASWRARRPPA